MSPSSTSLPPATLSFNLKWESDSKKLIITPHYTRQLPSDSGEKREYQLPPTVIAQGIKNFSDEYQYDWNSRAERNLPGVNDEISKKIHEMFDKSLQEWRGPDQTTEMEKDCRGLPQSAEIYLTEHDMLPSTIVVTNWSRERVHPLRRSINAMGLVRASVTAMRKMPELFHYMSDVKSARDFFQAVKVRMIGSTSFGDVVLDPTFRSYVVDQVGRTKLDPFLYCPPKMVSKIYEISKNLRRVLQGRMPSSSTEVESQLRHDINRGIQNSFTSQNACKEFLTLDVVPPSSLEAVHISSDNDAAPSIWLEHYPPGSVKPLENALGQKYPDDNIRVSTGLKSFNPSCVTLKRGSPKLRLSVQGRYSNGDPSSKAYYLDPISIIEVLKSFSNATVKAHDLPSVLQ
ncbi:hypothetical protein I302_103576 [Kwoniella bestiolae CBS 10118]|uniref:Uncharacterized protein n=1 Tax=Kwoniella bestiolae CBS 10118 TaxID=1296100 RepID=A0A1B9G8S3_9TREE|nr:hypothetical protein I302_02277 [Kwoniella bestiolae CBS 10118]OCF27435.1 hypothetical protein I302_02277 [Kwoniella bestiolae CBS 10118]